MEHELNLLPLSRRRLIDQQVTLNVFTVLITHLVIAFAIVTFSGLAVLGGLQAMTLFTARQASSQLQDEIANFQEKREEIARQNAALKQLYELSADNVAWSELVSDVLTLLPAGTSIEKIEGDQSLQPRLTLQGKATSRTSLIAIADRLKKVPWAQVVTAPQSNLIERINPSYSFNIIINQEAENNGVND